MCEYMISINVCFNEFKNMSKISTIYLDMDPIKVLRLRTEFSHFHMLPKVK